MSWSHFHSSHVGVFLALPRFTSDLHSCRARATPIVGNMSQKPTRSPLCLVFVLYHIIPNLSKWLISPNKPLSSKYTKVAEGDIQALSLMHKLIYRSTCWIYRGCEWGNLRSNSWSKQWTCYCPTGFTVKTPATGCLEAIKKNIYLSLLLLLKSRVLYKENPLRSGFWSLICSALNVAVLQQSDLTPAQALKVDMELHPSWICW